jgi:hypothetical protein
LIDFLHETPWCIFASYVYVMVWKNQKGAFFMIKGLLVVILCTVLLAGTAAPILWGECPVTIDPRGPWEPIPPNQVTT